jgi:hypothetical protein
MDAQSLVDCVPNNPLHSGVGIHSGGKGARPPFPGPNNWATADYGPELERLVKIQLEIVNFEWRVIIASIDRATEVVVWSAGSDCA